ncbi:hypothetical protein B0H19DRAFT_1065381 [Mycena capillaripes]|nr:hypothetical protein B0H19DRAFT_1065381 [Mycena capillaripes]
MIVRRVCEDSDIGHRKMSEDVGRYWRMCTDITAGMRGESRDVKRRECAHHLSAARPGGSRVREGGTSDDDGLPACRNVGVLKLRVVPPGRRASLCDANGGWIIWPGIADSQERRDNEGAPDRDGGRMVEVDEDCWHLTRDPADNARRFEYLPNWVLGNLALLLPKSKFQETNRIQCMPATRSKKHVPDPAPEPPTRPRTRARTKRDTPAAAPTSKTPRPKKTAAPANERRLRSSRPKSLSPTRSPAATPARSLSIDSSASRPCQREATPYPDDRGDLPSQNDDQLELDIADLVLKGGQAVLELEDVENNADVQPLPPPPSRSHSHSPASRGRSQSCSPLATHQHSTATSPVRGRTPQRSAPQYKDPPKEVVESDDSASDNDYAKTREQKKRERGGVKNGEIPREVDASHNASAKTKRKSGGKGKAKEGDVPEGGTDNARRAGPLPNECKAEADAEIIDLGQKYGKDPQTIHRYLGTVIKLHRELSSWNTYQSWITADDGGRQTKPEDLPASEWTKYVSAEYEKALTAAGLDYATKPTSEAVFAAIPDLKQWSDKRRAAVRDLRVESGAFAGDVQKIAATLTKICTLAYDECGLQGFGYLIDTVDHRSVAFNGSEATTRLRHDQKATIRGYENRLAMIEAQVKKEGADLANGEADGPLPSECVSDGWDRDKVAIEVGRGDIEQNSAEADKYQMSWTWADHGFTKQMRILGWPDKMAAEGRFPKQSFAQTTFSNPELKAIIPGLEKARGNPKYADDAKVDVDNRLRVVEWTEEEQELPVKEQGGVPLVVAVSGAVLVKVSNSRKWVVQSVPANGVKSAKPAEGRRRRMRGECVQSIQTPTAARNRPAIPLTNARVRQRWRKRLTTARIVPPPPPPPPKRARTENPPRPPPPASPSPSSPSFLSAAPDNDEEDYTDYTESTYGRAGSSRPPDARVAQRLTHHADGYAESGPSKLRGAEYGQYAQPPGGPPDARQNGWGYGYGGYGDDHYAPQFPAWDDHGRYERDRYYQDPPPSLPPRDDPPPAGVKRAREDASAKRARLDTGADVARMRGSEEMARKALGASKSKSKPVVLKKPEQRADFSEAEKRRLKSVVDGYRAEDAEDPSAVLVTAILVKDKEERSPEMIGWVENCTADRRSKVDTRIYLKDVETGVWHRLREGRFHPIQSSRELYEEMVKEYGLF